MIKVFVNGTFDLLHVGHLELLKYAKTCGDMLMVAIDSDERVREKKGPSRPIHNQEERRLFLSMLKPVDHVTFFDSDEYLAKLIKAYRPDIMIVGSDWKDKPVIGSEHAKKLVFFDRIDGYSTTQIIEGITDR